MVKISVVRPVSLVMCVLNMKMNIMICL